MVGPHRFKSKFTLYKYMFLPSEIENNVIESEFFSVTALGIQR